MARRKKTSATLTKAEKRLASIKSIDTKLDLGNGITVAWYEKEIAKLRQEIERHNIQLSQLDNTSNAIADIEKKLASASENVLMGVKIKFGRDSSQYEMAGGTRMSDRRRRRRTTETTAEPALA